MQKDDVLDCSSGQVVDCRRIVEEELPLYTCTKSYDSELPDSSGGNQTRSYNELATLMYVTGKQLIGWA